MFCSQLGPWPHLAGDTQAQQHLARSVEGPLAKVPIHGLEWWADAVPNELELYLGVSLRLDMVPTTETLPLLANCCICCRCHRKLADLPQSGPLTLR